MKDKSVFIGFFGDWKSPPVADTIKYLIEHRQASVWALKSSLSRHHADRIELKKFVADETSIVRSWRAPVPPWNYPLHLLVPLRLPPVDTWIGMDPISTLRGYLHKAFISDVFLIHWSIDFSPRRFRNGALNRLFRWLERMACKHADLRLEISAAAKEARENKFRGIRLAPSLVVPIGTWPQQSAPAWKPKDPLEIVYTGSLDDRNGVRLLPEIAAGLLDRGVSFRMSITGGGPLLEYLKLRIRAMDLESNVNCFGYVTDDGQLSRILANAHIGLAPYSLEKGSFTYYADPSKIKSYASHRLAILATRAMNDWRDLEKLGVIIPVDAEAQAFADRIASLEANPGELEHYRGQSHKYAATFSWLRLLDSVFDSRYGQR